MLREPQRFESEVLNHATQLYHVNRFVGREDKYAYVHPYFFSTAGRSPHSAAVPQRSVGPPVDRTRPIAKSVEV